jgi:outer membrane lipopolysaccharide assembly protein LptE/RlpB
MRHCLLWLASVLILANCGFYLRGSQFPSTDPQWIHTIALQGFSPRLQQNMITLIRGVRGLSLEDNATPAIAPLVLPPHAVASPSVIPAPSPPSSSPPIHPTSKKKLTLILDTERLESTANINDRTTINQEVRLTYEVKYRLVDSEGKAWREGVIEERAQFNFSEDDRLSSDNKRLDTETQLYRLMARNLLQFMLSASPPQAP